MEQTYGQLKENNGAPYKYEDFEKEVAERLVEQHATKLNSSQAKLCKRLFKQGHTLADTVGVLILNP